MPVLDHFKIIAPYYDRMAGGRAPLRLIESLDLSIRGALLDAGGGTGRVAHELRDLVNLAVVVDESVGMLAQAAQKDGLRPAQAHTERLPFASETFERIIMIDALHHVANQQFTADELWRVLKPGGRIVIEELDNRRFATRLIALGEKLVLMRSHFLDPDLIAGLFAGKKNPSARVRIETEGLAVWITIDKA